MLMCFIYASFPLLAMEENNLCCCFENLRERLGSCSTDSDFTGSVGEIVGRDN